MATSFFIAFIACIKVVQLIASLLITFAETDGPTDGPMDGGTDSLVQMHGRI